MKQDRKKMQARIQVHLRMLSIRTVQNKQQQNTKHTDIQTQSKARTKSDRLQDQ